MIEVIGAMAVMTFTNLYNHVNETEVDFPVPAAVCAVRTVRSAAPRAQAQRRIESAAEPAEASVGPKGRTERSN